MSQTSLQPSKDITLKDITMTSHSPRQTAAVLLIGNELLSGQTVDKNMNYIAKSLFKHGVDLRECAVIADVQEDIIRVVKDFSTRFTYVFTTGGIGPTHDDITAETMAKAFNRPFVQNKEAFEILREKYGEANLTDSRGRMTMMPEGVELIYNQATAAPGFRIENVFVMAGIPYIMQTMMDHALTMIPKGQARHKSLVLIKVYESFLAPGLHQIQDQYPEVEIGSYPHWIEGQAWGVRVAITSSDEELYNQALEAVLSLAREFDKNAAIIDETKLELSSRER